MNVLPAEELTRRPITNIYTPLLTPDPNPPTINSFPDPHQPKSPTSDPALDLNTPKPAPHTSNPTPILDRPEPAPPTGNPAPNLGTPEPKPPTPNSVPVPNAPEPTSRTSNPAPARPEPAPPTANSAPAAEARESKPPAISPVPDTPEPAPRRANSACAAEARESKPPAISPVPDTPEPAPRPVNSARAVETRESKPPAINPIPDPNTPEPAPRPANSAPTSETRKPKRPTNSPIPDLDAVRLARAYLLRVAEPPAPALIAFIAQVGAVTAAQLIRDGTAPPAVLEATNARRAVDLAEQDLATAAKTGARLLIPEDDEWPTWPFTALDLANARGVRWAGHPIALWARGTGRLSDLTERAVAVIGARAATSYGDHIAAELGYDLGAAGVTVVSGAAYGIDGAAHRGAISADGTTIAVLGCGVDQPYPLGHSGLLNQIAEHGLVLSEYPPGTPPARHRFLIRNRLIAACSAGTVVVEAGRRSGSRNTAATAQALGRIVMAVPGPITSAMSVGCHEMLRTGDAYLVTGSADVLEAVGRIGADLVEPVPEERRPTDQLDDQQLQVHDALDGRTALSPEQVAFGSGVPLDRVRAVLPLLELCGLAECDDTGWRRLSGSGRRS